MPVHVCCAVCVEYNAHPGGTLLGAAQETQATKRWTYAGIASQQQFEMLPFIVETCGGLGLQPTC